MRSPLLLTLSLLAVLACDKHRAANEVSDPAESDASPPSVIEPEPEFAPPPPAENDDPPESDDVVVNEPMAGSGLTWFSTCGDPACSGYGGPWPGVPACGSETKGQPCGPEGATCDFQSGCNARLICAAKDPKAGPGGCPRSRARFKQDIEYLELAELDAYHRELLALELATFRYRDASDERVRLGVILEDGEHREHAVWADSTLDRVDLYGYASLAIASAQVQAREIAELRAEVAALRAELTRLAVSGC